MNVPSGEQPTSKVRSVFKAIPATLVLLVIAWFLFAGRISYAASECSKGVKQCVVGVGVALGVVDVYDKNGHCTGVGCHF